MTYDKSVRYSALLLKKHW